MSLDELVPLRVFLLGAALLTTGTMGFYLIPGMINEDASGLRIVNAFYCSAVTLTTYVAGTSNECCICLWLAPIWLGVSGHFFL